jgi:intracellular sulfur oxidation DsrE/DsrF family protein
MPKTVIHLFHDDPDSLRTGSHVAERVRQVAAEQGVALEVFIFGPAQAALTDASDAAHILDYNAQIDDLVAAGVPVGACLNASRGAGSEEVLGARGLTLQYARDAFVRWTQESATVISF